MPTRKVAFSVSLVGAGKVGSTIAALLRRRGHRIVSVISRSRSSARVLGRLLGSPIASTSLKNLSPRTDLLLIATPDEMIADVAAEVAGNNTFENNRLIVFHPSGILTCDVLGALGNQGAKVFSLHPIQTFPNGVSLQDQVSLMKDVWYGFEGGTNVRAVARSIVKDLGGRFLEIPKEEKILYHVACVFAANYPTVLLGAVERLAKALGLPGLKPFSPLVETAVRQALDRGPGASLTGPLARGSHTVVQRHLEALHVHDPALATLYEAIGRFGLDIARESNRLTGDQIKVLAALLTEKK
ncbi:MAG: Rossmann-like and DUF2520 domain-containing protein [Bacteroidota bacterium]